MLCVAGDHVNECSVDISLRNERLALTVLISNKTYSITKTLIPNDQMTDTEHICIEDTPAGRFTITILHSTHSYSN